MKRPYACNYAVIRFMPYPETEEFVNVGVVMSCPQIGFFAYRMEKRHRRRVTNFFPEMDARIFTEGKAALTEEIGRIARMFPDHPGGRQDHLSFSREMQMDIFKELVRPREVLFRFGGIGTILAEDPAQELQRLFSDYVERQFASHDEYQEKIMTRRLKVLLQEIRLGRRFREMTLGDDIYHVKLPFVREEDGHVARAIAPLNLAQEDTTRIIEHGTQWFTRIERLRKMQKAPAKMLFVMHHEAGGKRHDAAMRIRDEFQQRDLLVLPEKDESQVLDFASAV